MNRERRLGKVVAEFVCRRWQSLKSAGSPTQRIQPAMYLESSSQIQTRHNQTITSVTHNHIQRGRNHVSKHHPTPPSAPREPGENLSRVSGSRCDGQMASAKRIHRQGSSDGRESWRQLQNVVYELLDR